MNRIYKVIYSKARQCSIVVSEFAKSSHKNSRKGASHTGTPALARIIATALAAGALTWGIAPGVSWAAPGNDQSAVVFDDKGSLKSTDANISHQILQFPGSFPEGEGQSIALGKGAHAFMQGGSKAENMLFGMKKAAGAIAIGEGSQALSQSIAIGNRTYTGDIGDVNISNYKNFYGDGGAGSGVGSVLLGTNSYTGGTLSTLIGDYSIMSTAYPNAYDSHYGSYLQNAGAVSVGALNSIESATSDYNSGVANSIVGLANKTNNANGALIYGAGNEITNSSEFIFPPTSGSSAKSAAESLRTSIKNYPGGAVLAIGGGNTIDRSIRSQVMGVNNTLTGNSYNSYYSVYSSQYNMIDGYNNTASNVNHAYVIGANNTIQGKKFSDATKDGVLNETDREKAQKDDNLIVIGDNHTLANDVSNNIILGTADETLTTSASNIVILGHNANAKFDGGVAIGSGSIADTEAKVFGWDPKTKIASTSDDKAWKSSWAAVSIGDDTHTRQITNVAAGLNATDAVNVAQLKAAMENAAPKIDFVAGDGIQIEKDSTGTKYTIKANITGTGDKTTTDITKVVPKEGDSSGTGSSVTSGSGKALEITTKTNPISFAADEGTAANVKPSETLGILGDKTNINTKVDGSNITVSLKENITVDSVKVGNTTVNNEGVTIAGGPSMTVNGINAGGKKITNVADGTDASDAVNYGQLQNVENQVTSNTQNINYLNGRVGELGDRINKVGAGAAALAALHPLDYDPEDKWDFAAGVGNYRNATAAAVGLFYRPNERTMFNLGWTMGDDRNMVNGGFSLKFGKSNKYIKYSKAEMASVIDKQSREIAELKARDVQNAKDKAEMKADNAEMKAEIEALKKQVEALAAKK